MKLFPVVTKKITHVVEGVAQAINFRQDTKPALSIAPRVVGTLVRPEVKPAVSFSASIATLLSNLKPALAVTTRAEGSAAKPAILPGARFSSVASLGGASTRKSPAMNLTQIVYGLNHRRGGSAQTNSGWTDPANAISGTNGRRDGVNATTAGAATARTATLTLTYPAQPNRSDLTVSSVLLHFFTSMANNTGGLLGSVVHSYSFDGSSFTSFPTLVNHDNLTTPATYDITSAVAGDWAKIASLRTRVVATFSAAATTVTSAVDAIEVEVVASRTDLI